MNRPFDSAGTVRELKVGDRVYQYYSLAAAEESGLAGISRLPYALKVLLENQIRHGAAGGDAGRAWGMVDWLQAGKSEHEIEFKPARMMIPDSSGFPLFGDMAAMRDAMKRLGADPQRINPSVAIDFIIDHGITVDHAGSADAAQLNLALEIERNRERYSFIRWGQQAFANVRVIPPGSGICHQVSIERLARVVWTEDREGRTFVYPESLLGMDSHTAMINCLGIVGWGVGGLEGGTAALGEPMVIQIPEAVGCRLVGKLKPGVTATDLVLTLTKAMRGHKVVGKTVEFFGAGVKELSLPDRATLSNMTPEYGANMGFFPVDAETLRFLKITGRDAHQIALVEAYCRAQGLWRDDSTPVPQYSAIVELDLGTVEPSAAGPQRPNQLVSLPQLPAAFAAAHPGTSDKVDVQGASYQIGNGDIVLAAITSCTNTANPDSMVAAGLLAKNAIAKGLKTKPWVKTSFAPGSLVVSDYLAQGGLQQPLNELGFYVVGYGCTTCMGNSGPLSPEITQAIGDNQLAAVAVLSGNRNFEGRIHPKITANFLMSPALVVAYALAGSITKDLNVEPLGTGNDGKPVFLKDIWPDTSEIKRIVGETLMPVLFERRYKNLEAGPPEWQQVPGGSGTLFGWNKDSTFVRRPPFFDDMPREPLPLKGIKGARVLAMFGDMLTTDHISPIGTISDGTPSAKYLESLGIKSRDFVSYAARRLNHDVMIRGTFANIRIKNELVPGREGSFTRHMPSGDTLSIHEAAERYAADKVPLIIIGGGEYGAGSSRDWAAKGARLLGARAIIAESFERIHRSNLVGMGVLPLQFTDGASRKTLQLDGSEIFDMDDLGADLSPRHELGCTITRADGSTERINLLVRLDTLQEIAYYRHGGTFQFVIRSRLAA